ncbi:PleD family two-component system response regulator [uncultured Alsobacter sp.]|uniref:response regulator n=1 Tax=uncultured Alsobacter sp. TaxID=1748258 RepID=UPI0025DD7243|nr:response regulator [uncultured Alsobacter sp.]
MGTLRRIWSFRYLVADDSLPQRKLAVRTLRTFGAKFVSDVGSGADVLSAVLERSPDVILLDWFMTDMNGDVVFRSLSSIDLAPRPAIIVMTALPTAAMVAMARDLGAVTVIRKPFAPDVLLRSIARVAETVPSVEVEGARHKLMPTGQGDGALRPMPPESS